MIVNAHFGRWGASFYCSMCGYRLIERGNKLTHPTHKGLFRKTPIMCGVSGKSCFNPFRCMQLEVEADSPTPLKPEK